MDLERLRSFLVVSETRSFSLAAARLHVTQSTVSGRIQALEAELGQVLFRRGRAGVDPTPAGHALQPHARRIVQTWEQARQQVALPAGFHDIFRLGGPVGLWDGVITRWIAWMREHAPAVALHLEGSYSDTLFDQLSAGLLDAGIMYLPRRRADIVAEALLAEELVLVRHAAMTAPWHTNYVLIDWGEEFAIAHTQAFPDIQPPAVTAGLGVLGIRYILDLQASGYVPASSASEFIRRGEFVLIDGAPRFTRLVYLAYPAQPRNPELLATALAGLRALCQTGSAGGL